MGRLEKNVRYCGDGDLEYRRGGFLERWDGIVKDIPSLRTAATRVEARKATVERNFILNGLEALIDSVEEDEAVARRSEREAEERKLAAMLMMVSISRALTMLLILFPSILPSDIPSLFFQYSRGIPICKCQPPTYSSIPNSSAPEKRDRIETEWSNSPCVPTSKHGNPNAAPR